MDASVAAREKLRRSANALAGKGGRHSQKGTVEIKGVVDQEDEGVVGQADIEMDSGENRFILPRRRNNPQTAERLLQKWESLAAAGQATITVTIPFPKLDDRLARLGDLKAAYLTLFALFGYSYAFDPALEIVRRQLQDPATERIPPQAWIPIPRVSRAPLEILVVRTPIRFVGVTLRSGVVFLPWPRTQIDLYRELAALADREVNVEGDILEWPRQMMMLGDFHGRE